MEDRAEAGFGERIRQALAQFPGAVWLDDTPVPNPIPLTTAPLEGQEARLWEPTAERPAEYPAALPFLPRARALVMTWSANPEVVAVIWDDPPQGEAAFHELVTMSQLEGWTESEPGAGPSREPILERSLTRADCTRIFWAVTHGPRSGVSVIQLTGPQEAA
jgi:hypothetical protein